MISRREWLALVGKLGVIGAAASLGLSLPAHAVTRPNATLNPLFLNASPRPVLSRRTDPRMVENLMSGGNGVVFGYDRYFKGAGSDWGDFPTNTPSITWGYNVDGGQWLECATTAAGVTRVWAALSFTAVVGETYFLSFTVDSKTGSHANGNATLASGTFTGGTVQVNNPSPGRYALGGLCTVGGAIQVRLGIGVNSTNAADATIRYSNVMVERVPKGQTYPNEYVRPGDQQVFAYTRSSVVTSGLEGTPTVGDVYAIPRRSSVLVLGDSFANDATDFPGKLRIALRGKPIAVNFYGVAGARIDQITDQIASGMARQALTPTASPYTVCIAHGGVNDVAQGNTFATAQTRRLAQIAAVEAAGMRPILLTIPPYNPASAGQQTIIDDYNAWIKTLGYPLYDLYADANDGAGDFKASWNASDGVHPGSAQGEGYDIMGRRLADLLMLIGD